MPHATGKEWHDRATPKREARSIAALERRRTALELRKRGFAYSEIADHLGVTRQAVHQMVKKGIAEILDETRESAEEVRTLELERLDRMFMRLYKEAMPSHPDAIVNHKAIETMLKIMDRRSKLMGLDAPSKHEVMTIDQLDAQIAALETELAQNDSAPEPVEAD